MPKTNAEQYDDSTLVSGQQIGLHSLHHDALRKICDDLNTKEIVYLASTQSIFYGKNQRSEFNFYFLAKKRKLLEIKNSQYFTDKDKNSHFLLINNKVYAWGCKEHGKLSVGNFEYKNTPTEINLNHLDLVPTDKIKQVIVGGNYVIYLTEQGRCFACGLNDDGQLGLGDYENKNSLTEINFNHLFLARTDKIKQVIIGVATFFLTEQGRCFVCGKDDDLSVGDDNDGQNKPTEINFTHLNLAPTDKIKQVVGENYHIKFITDYGRQFG